MLLPLFLSLLAQPVAAPASAPTPVLSSLQDPKAEAGKPDKREDIKKELADYEALIGQRGKKDEEARKLIDKLLQEFPECGPKDRESIANGIAKAFDQKRVPSAEEKDENPEDIYKLYFTAAVALGHMAPEGIKPLTKLINDRSHKANVKLLRTAILQLGKCKDPGSVNLFLDLLNNKDNGLAAAGAEALGEYTDIALDKRKMIFEKLLNQIMALKVEVDQNQSNNTPDPTKSERYQALVGAGVATLQRLSGHDERDPAEWQRWWNKNKKANWPVE